MPIVRCYHAHKFFCHRVLMQPSDPRSDPRFVSSSRPLNRRTTRVPSNVKQDLNPAVKRQLAAIKAKHALGLPLLDQIQIRTAPTSARQYNFKQIFQLLILTSSAFGILLAAIQRSTSLAGVSGLVLLVFGVWYGISRHKGSQHLPVQTDTSHLFAFQSLSAFDRAIAAFYEEQHEPTNLKNDLPLQAKFDELKTLLQAIKAQFVRIHQLVTNANDIGELSFDDRFYLNECLQRYLPDSLDSYLRVPAQARWTHTVQNEKTALDLLLNQLQLLHTEIDQREQLLTKNAAEQLVRQQRFLEMKSRQ